MTPPTDGYAGLVEKLNEHSGSRWARLYEHDYWIREAAQAIVALQARVRALEAAIRDYLPTNENSDGIRERRLRKALAEQGKPT
jgi:hypothetical protein